MLNFLSLFQIYSSDSFIKNRFTVKILEIFAVWIDLTLARFNQLALSLQQQVASFYAESNSIFGKNFTTIIKDFNKNLVDCADQK